MPRKYDTDDRDIKITVRLAYDERNEISEKAKESGLTIEEFMRAISLTKKLDWQKGGYIYGKS